MTLVLIWVAVVTVNLGGVYAPFQVVGLPEFDDRDACLEALAEIPKHPREDRRTCRAIRLELRQ